MINATGAVSAAQPSLTIELKRERISVGALPRREWQFMVGLFQKARDVGAGIEAATFA
jgi:hypothetical protein